MKHHNVVPLANTPFSFHKLALACTLALPMSALGDTQLVADGESKEVSGQTYEHSSMYQNAVKASNGGTILAENVTAIGHGNGGYGVLSQNAGSSITFNGGSISTDGQGGDAVTAADEGLVVLKGVDIRTTGDFANAVTSKNGSVIISDSSINASGNYSSGLVAGNGGYISATNVDITAARGILAHTGSKVDGSGITVLTTGNIGVQVDNRSEVNLDHSSVETTGAHASAFVVSTGSSAKLDNVKVKTTGDGSIGLLANDGALITLDSTSISTAGVSAHGMLIQVNSAADARNVEIITTGNSAQGLFIADSASLDFKNGSVKTSGDGAAAVLVNNARADISHSNISTTGSSSHALRIAGNGGTLRLSNSNVVAGGANSNAINSNISAGQVGRYEISDSVLRADQAAAIQVVGAGHTEIVLKNSSIEGGTGELFSTNASSGSSSLLADASSLRGDISVSSSAYDADFTMSNGSLWKGAGSGIDTLSLVDSGWLMTGDSNTRHLSMDGATVSFDHSDGIYKTLTTDALSGNGVFLMNTDLATLKGDLLIVQDVGMASGNHQLVVGDSGHEPANGDGRLKLVETKGGDAQFDLYGGHVDAGAFRYGLERDGDDWLLARAGGKPSEELSKGANAAVAAHSASTSMWSAQMNSLIKRLGELRMGKDDGGVWTRGISKRFDISENSSRAYTQNVTGIQIGADKAIALEKGKLYLGAMVGTAKANLNFGEGASGGTDSKMVGVYATYLNDNGVYVDTVLKHSQFDNEIKISTNLNTSVKSSYKTRGVGADIEVGKHINLGEGWFVEPQLEITATRTQGGNYTASNGLRVKSDDMDSIESRLGSLFGRSLELSNGMKAQPYVKASYIAEHAGNSKVSVNGNKLNAVSTGDRVELGFGGVLQVSEKSKISLEAEYAKGNAIEQPWGVNVGYRYLW